MKKSIMPYLKVIHRRSLHGFVLVFIAIMLALGMGITIFQPARAHESIEIGPYRILFEWEKEPAIIGERNAIVMEVLKGDEPVTGLENTLEVSVLYAGRAFLGIPVPIGEPGVYAIEILPTVRGQYELSLSGTIEDLEVNEIVELEEILSTQVLDFPEAQPDPRELQTEIENMQTQLQAYRLISIAGSVLGFAGLLSSGLLWRLWRRDK